MPPPTSSTPLTPTDRDLLRQSLVAPVLQNLWPARLGAGVGMMAGVLIWAISNHRDRWEAIVPLLVFWAFSLGLFLFVAHLRRQAASMTARIACMEKWAVSGILLRLENVNRRQVRYVLDSGAVDAYLPMARNLRNAARRTSPIDKLAAHVPQPVTLHLTRLEDGGVLLLRAQYTGPSQTFPMTVDATDRSALLRQALGRVVSAMIVFGLVIGLWIAIAGFSMPMKFVTVTIALVLMLVGGYVLIDSRAGARQSVRKAVLNTVIMERIDVSGQAYRSRWQETWYRLGDGTPLRTGLASMAPGERVAIEHVVDADGSMGELIRITRKGPTSPA